jgi:pimeloyl-ACP methyl ester carboxylesterase
LKFRNSKIILVVSLSLALQACSGGMGLVPTAVPTATGTPLPTATLTATPIPTETPLPSVTPTATETPPPTSTPEPDLSPQRVTFYAEDGRPLVGYYYPAWKPGQPVVVLMHQFDGDQSMWQKSPILDWLRNFPVPDPTSSPTPSADGKLPLMPAELSFAVFTFDFRGHGESLPADIIQDGYRAHAAEFLLDAAAAYQIAGQFPGVDSGHVISIGASIGADAAVDTCGAGCSGAFAISPGSWLKVNYAQAVNQLLAAGKQVRCVYAVNDGPAPATCWSVAPSDSYKIFAYPGSKHGMTFVMLPRKMEASFGPNLLDFLLAATQ